LITSESYKTMSDEWIPVKKSLPPMGKRFDAWAHGEYTPNCGAYVGSWTDESRRETMLVKGTTHWKPIPSAPKYDYIPCKNVVNGSCSLHNLHCGYPECEHEPYIQTPTQNL
jgi:hypothetical protein